MKSSSNMKLYENQLYKKGCKYIAGFDEVGRGCIAGPLVAAMVIFDSKYINTKIKDSKQLTPKNRQLIYDEIMRDALEVQIFEISPSDVDKLNPKQASRYAMLKCLENSKIQPDHLITDFEKIDSDINQLNLKRGDSVSQTVAAASIIAKVYRDHIMDKLSIKYPWYSFEKNKGYLTNAHSDAIKKYGPIKNVHRFSYKPIKK